MTILGKIVVSIIVLGSVFIGTYYVSHREGEEVVSVPVTQKEHESVGSSTKKISFVELLKQDGSYHCDVSQLSGENSTHGEVYVHAEKVRGHFSTSIIDRVIESDILVRDGYTYSWSSVSKKIGYKTKIISSENADSTSTPRAYSWNPESVGDYTCTDWTYDESTFTIPSDIKFIDSGR